MCLKPVLDFAHEEVTACHVALWTARGEGDVEPPFSWGQQWEGARAVERGALSTRPTRVAARCVDAVETRLHSVQAFHPWR